MKTLKLFVLISLTCGNTFSQQTDTVYYNYNWEKLPNSKKHKYYCIAQAANDSLVNAKFYYKNGKLNMIGSYKSIELDDEVGEHVYYTKKGEEYMRILYDYDKINDTIKYYLVNKYELNGDSIEIRYVVEDEIKYTGKGIEINRTRYDFWNFYSNKTGEKSHTVEYKNNKMHGALIDFFDLRDQIDKKDVGKVFITGTHRNNKKDGVWTYYRPNGSLLKKQIYAEGKIVAEEKFD